MSRIGPEAGVGAPCPVCPAWFAQVDEVWRDHVAGEHPAAWARIRQAAARADATARDRAGSRVSIGHQLDTAAALVAEVRERGELLPDLLPELLPNPAARPRTGHHDERGPDPGNPA